MKDKILIANILRYTARYLLLSIGVLVFVFSLLSGAEDMNFKSVLRNSPNAIPWLLLIVLIFIAWKWELIGGVVITALGLFMIWFFNIGGNNFFLVTFYFNTNNNPVGSIFYHQLVSEKKSK